MPPELLPEEWEHIARYGGGKRYPCCGHLGYFHPSLTCKVCGCNALVGISKTSINYLPHETRRTRLLEMIYNER